MTPIGPVIAQISGFLIAAKSSKRSVAFVGYYRGRASREPVCSEQSHVGRCRPGHRASLFRAVDRVRLRLRRALRTNIMIFDYALAGFVMLGLLVYLTYALLKPEHF